MGLFANIFGKREVANLAKELPWIALADEAQLVEIAEKSNTRPQLIFKHSTTCGISNMVLNRFTESYDLESGQMDLYFLDLHAYRSISNEVAHRFQIMHESPQLLIIKNGEVIFHTSHGAIMQVDLHQFIA